MQKATYVRLYVDKDGESHFEDLAIDLLPVEFAPPAAPLNVARFLPAAHTLWVGAPAGWTGEQYHPAPQRQIFCFLQGACEITASDGEVRRFTAGSVILHEDTWGQGHATRVTGDEELLIFGVALPDGAE